MRFNIVLAILKKEILELLRDKKTLFVMIILPILMYPLLLIGITQFLQTTMDDMEKQNIKIEAYNTDSLFQKTVENVNIENEKSKIVLKQIKSDKLSIYLNSEKKPTEKLKKAFDNRNLNALIVKDINKNYNVYLNSIKDDSSIINKKVQDLMDQYKTALIEKDLRNKNLNVEKTLNPISINVIETADNQEIAGSLMGKILPFIMIMGVLMGAIYPAIDLIAGEKERGTLETLFTLPISNLELLAGKYLAVSLGAIVTALLNILSVGASLIYLTSLMDLQGQSINLSIFNMKMIFPLIVTIISIIIFAMVISALSMCLCSFAKSYKEAQNYITPLTLLTMIPSYASMMPNMNLNTTTSLIPVVNISLLIKAIMVGTINYMDMWNVLIVNIIFVIAVLILLSKIFDSEDILFGSNNKISFLQKRSELDKYNVPTSSDGIILYISIFLILIFAGSYLQLKFKFVGLALNQFVMFIFLTIYALYLKIDFKKIFAIKKPTFKELFFGIKLWLITLIVVMLVSFVTTKFIPNANEMSKEIQKTLFNENLFLNILVVALIPAVVEELIFRGFLLSSFSNKNISIDLNDNGTYVENKKRGRIVTTKAVILSGLLFGLMHIQIIRIIPVSILGLSFGYAMKKTDSIFVTMEMHFLNNLFSVLAMNFAGILLF